MTATDENATIPAAAVPLRDRYRWFAALGSSALSPNARHVALTLAVHMQPNGTIAPRWTPGMSRLAAEMGFHPDNKHPVNRGVKELSQTGYLIVTPAGRKNLYAAAVPAHRAGEFIDEPAGNGVAASSDGVAAHTDNGVASHTQSPYGSPSLSQQPRAAREGRDGSSTSSTDKQGKASVFDTLGGQRFDRYRDFLTRTAGALNDLSGDREGDRWLDAVTQMGAKVEMATLVDGLLERGHDGALFDALTAAKLPGRSAYSGCANIAGVTLGRVRAYQGEYGSLTYVPFELPAVGSAHF